jgi:ubiquitin C-terminal hydrolase
MFVQEETSFPLKRGYRILVRGDCFRTYFNARKIQFTGRWICINCVEPFTIKDAEVFNHDPEHKIVWMCTHHGFEIATKRRIELTKSYVQTKEGERPFKSKYRWAVEQRKRNGS